MKEQLQQKKLPLSLCLCTLLFSLLPNVNKRPHPGRGLLYRSDACKLCFGNPKKSVNLHLFICYVSSYVDLHFVESYSTVFLANSENQCESFSLVGLKVALLMSLLLILRA